MNTFHCSKCYKEMSYIEWLKYRGNCQVCDEGSCHTAIKSFRTYSPHRNDEGDGEGFETDIVKVGITDNLE